LETALVKRLTQLRQRWQLLTQQLNTLSPLATLSRGYTITRDANTGQVLYSLKGISQNQIINIQFADGSISAIVNVAPTKI
jgi:exodeoxyribonuclease VII large subunit